MTLSSVVMTQVAVVMKLSSVVTTQIAVVRTLSSVVTTLNCDAINKVYFRTKVVLRLLQFVL